jgi:hypothetical protein
VTGGTPPGSAAAVPLLLPPPAAPAATVAEAVAARLSWCCCGFVAPVLVALASASAAAAAAAGTRTFTVAPGRAPAGTTKEYGPPPPGARNCTDWPAEAPSGIRIVTSCPRGDGSGAGPNPPPPPPPLQHGKLQHPSSSSSSSSSDGTCRPEGAGTALVQPPRRGCRSPCTNHLMTGGATTQARLRQQAAAGIVRRRQLQPIEGGTYVMARGSAQGWLASSYPHTDTQCTHLLGVVAQACDDDEDRGAAGRWLAATCYCIIGLYTA